jgi:NADH-quinone oxidoreductase subunit G
LADATGARLAWVPRRAGERGALDSGALPNLLPGGRQVADASTRSEVERVWGGGSLPDRPGRDANAILRATADGSLAALVVGGVDPDDFADPALAGKALETAGFIVSLEIRASAVTAHADVVLPVAPAAEKAGRFVTWEGRRRPFDQTIANTGAMSDGRVLHALAEELDIDLGLASVEAARAELVALAPVSTPTSSASSTSSGGAPSSAVQVPAAGYALLATWHELIDAGRMQDGDEYLAGTTKPARAIISAATAAAVGVAEGELVGVSTEHGALVLPTVVGDIADGVVWLPTNARGCAVRATLRAGSGTVVRLTRSDAPPVVGIDGGAR